MAWRGVFWLCCALRVADWHRLTASLPSRWERMQVQPYVLGARMLRQDPVECLFSFICSSNNHISRIHGMVERLAAQYGEPFEV